MHDFWNTPRARCALSAVAHGGRLRGVGEIDRSKNNLMVAVNLLFSAGRWWTENQMWSELESGVLVPHAYLNAIRHGVTMLRNSVDGITAEEVATLVAALPPLA